MIIKLLMEILKGLIFIVLSLFPSMPTVDWMNNLLTGFSTMMESIGMFISVKTVSACFLLILVCFNARAIWSVIMWVLRKIPGVS